jgi:MoaA/NifB/PqqE/SkfB family radical SAM enzyme
MDWFGTYETSSLRLEASTICQLACPSCATTHGTIKRQIGAGFLKFDDFRRLVDENPWVCEIELSNWGEIFLNPELEQIIAYAYRRHVALTAWNGVNFNHVKDGVLEALARYQFRAITCSIDGVSQSAYEAYRRNGQLERVLGNIRRLNEYKKRWKTIYPLLTWQMIAFGHNEHEIVAAQALARDLGMGFFLKLNYDETFSPVKALNVVRTTVARTHLKTEEELPGERDEYLHDDICAQLWRQPQINFDGTLLGCCLNMWASFGANVFAVGVKGALAAEKLQYAKEMLLGRAVPRDDVPCTACAIYRHRATTGRWLHPPALEPGVKGFVRRRGLGRGWVWIDHRLGRWLRPVLTWWRDALA